MLARIAFALAMAAAVTSVKASEPAHEDLLDIPLEQLMDLEITTASKFPQTKMNAPTAVTVITADDIKDYGYRTLADVLRSIRNLHTTYDRVYEYVGSRGFGRSGDYNSRFLLMIDGRRVNDVIYDSAFIGTDGPVDMENVARVEFVPGSGSALYGSNAFFGVINVITKQGKDLQGGEITGGFGSYGMDREKGSIGYRFDNGADALLSASRQRSDGHQALYFDRLSDPNTPSFTSHHLDGDKTDRLFGKFSYEGFTLEGSYSDRSKNIPIAFYGVDLNTPQTFRDRNGFTEARYEKAFANGVTASARSYWGFYNFDANFVFSGISNFDLQSSQWWGSEIKTLFSFGKHKVVIGSEYQSNFEQNMKNFDQSPYVNYLDTRRNSYRYGFYLQDEFAITNYLTLNAGARYDYYSVSGKTANPRIALIYKPWDEMAFKLLYGTAFRAPNLYELFYQSPFQILPQGLRPEKVESFEAIIEYQATHNLRLTASAFHNDVTDLINLISSPDNPSVTVYNNNQLVKMHGFEFEGEYRWNNGARVRGSYTYSYAKDLNSNGWLENSPRHLPKLNVSFPVWRNQLRAGAELQHVSQSKTKTGIAPSYTIANLTLTASKIAPNLDISASVYNLLDKRYFNVAGNETFIDQVPQDGRNFRIWLNYKF